MKTDAGIPLEGMMVQLISGKNGMRTTVFSDSDGHYEFPKLEPGKYTLRIAQPREFQPFVKKDVRDRRRWTTSHLRARSRRSFCRSARISRRR